MDVSSLAVELDLVMRRLRGRVRAESGVDEAGWTRPQLSALYRVVHDGPLSTSELAAFEYLRHQSMAQTVARLEQGGMVRRTPDPADGRRMLVGATRRGRELVDGLLVLHGHWLAEAITAELSEEEQQVVAVAVKLINRLADSDTTRDTDGAGSPPPR